MFHPSQDYILVRPIIRKQSDVLEIISHEKHCRGEILAVGPGKPNKHGKVMPLDAQVGQIVAFGDGNFDFYPKYYGPLQPDGTQECFRVIQEADVTFVIEEDADIPLLKSEIERLVVDLHTCGIAAEAQMQNSGQSNA